MKEKFKPLTVLFIFHFSFFISFHSSAQSDTIRVMAYNTLTFGPGSCQTPNTGQVSTMYPYLKAIYQFASPDIIGLDKMQCVKIASGVGISPITFPDTVISECFNPNVSYCPFTDVSGCLDGDGTILFYNTLKIGYLSTTTMYSGEEDIDLYKLYYKDPDLPSTHDTTFLYVIPCHTISGSSSSGRDGQDTTVMHQVKTMFTHTPNLIYMGDFNTHNSSEPGYEYLTQTSDTSFILDDPSFYPDAKLTYPINWSSNPTACPAELTTSTRSTTSPNSCGTTGGAGDWFDHILLSPWIVNNVNYISYIKNSYTTIGNDGNRIGVSVNSGTNNSAPSNVINALFNFSDKYPVMVTLLATDHLAGIENILAERGNITVNNPLNSNQVTMHFGTVLNNQNITMEVFDVCGRSLYKSAITVNNSTIVKDVPLVGGVYMIRFMWGGYNTTLKIVKE